MIYLDLVLLVNGAMDAFLLIFTAYLLRKKIKKLNLLLAAGFGAIPIFLIIYDLDILATIARIIIPAVMVAIGLRIRTPGDFIKGLLYFHMLAAACGGLYYALAGWLGLEQTNPVLTPSDLWILPAIALTVVGGIKIWEKVQKTNLFLDNVIYDTELAFQDGKVVKIKALLDTGNELRDPLTGSPVMLLEEKAVWEHIPEKVREFLQLPWRESADPWSNIWSSEDYCAQRLFFISVQGINGQTWLPGIRLGKVIIRQGRQEWEHPVTIAFVPQQLSNGNQFQALLHPELVPKNTDKEEAALC